MSFDKLIGERICANAFESVCNIFHDQEISEPNAIVENQKDGVKIDDNGRFYSETGIDELDVFDREQREEYQQFLDQNPDVSEELERQGVMMTLVAPEIEKLEQFNKQQLEARDAFIQGHPDIQEQLERAAQEAQDWSPNVQMGIGGFGGGMK